VRDPLETRGLWLKVQGRVQGVGFRAFVRREAASLGLAGWVRNMADGAVELQAWGAAEALGELRRRVREGPPGARVTALTELPAPPAPRDGGGRFEVRFS
jgi:acylphosphatase